MSALISSAQLSGISTAKIITKKEVKRDSPLVLLNKESLTLTNFSNTLKANSIDPLNTTTFSNGNDLFFDVNLFTERMETLSIKGRHSLNRQTSEFNLTYQFEKHEEVNGETVVGKYQFNMSIKAENLRSFSKSKYYEKEDILKFIRRITNEVMEITRDDKKTLKNIVFSSEDLKELSKSDQKSIGSLLQQLIYAILMMEQLKNLRNKRKNREEVILQPERKIYEATKKESNQEVSFKYTTTVQKIGKDHEVDYKNKNPRPS